MTAAMLSGCAGYCQLLQGMGNAVLAHDLKSCTGGVATCLSTGEVAGVDFLQHHEGDNRNWSVNHIADLIPLVHLINFEVVEPVRMQQVQKHLLEMIKRSRASSSSSRRDRR